MTAIFLVTIAALVGYVCGRAHSVGAHHEHMMAEWRDRCIGAALLPHPVLDLEAVEATP